MSKLTEEVYEKILQHEANIKRLNGELKELKVYFEVLSKSSSLDLTEFKVEGTTQVFKAKYEGRTVSLEVCGRSRWFSTEQITEIYQKLGQMLSTIKRNK